MEIDNGDETIRVDFEARKVVIHERYENLHILNDLFLALWFLVGSVMFFYKHWTYWGTWLFVLGSTQMAIGPLIRVSHKLHIRRFESYIGHFRNSTKERSTVSAEDTSGENGNSSAGEGKELW